MTRRVRGRLTYANVVATLALFAALSGTGIAASQLGKNSVGTRQLKAKSVTTGKLADHAVTGAKIAEGSITGANVNMAALGRVPTAESALTAENASAISGHTVSCPSGTTPIHGVCFDTNANPPVNTVKEAADACFAKGGWLPTPLQLYAIRSVLSLGTGIGPQHQYTDTYYSNTSGGNYRTIVVDGNGAITESEVNVPSRYICAYPLIR
jgi:hypothetical protein